MKTVEEIISQEPVFLQDWEGCQQEGVLKDFDGYGSESIRDTNIKILFAAYLYENYSGSAFVLFAKDGKLFEVNGGHCSCYGLEGQWEPEEVVLEELASRIKTNSYSFDGIAYELQNFIGV